MDADKKTPAAQYVEDVIDKPSEPGIVDYDEGSRPKIIQTDGTDESFLPSLPETLRQLNADELYAVEKGLTRKMDVRLLPILVIMFLLNILDRNNIASARLQGLEEDLKLTNVQ